MKAIFNFPQRTKKTWFNVLVALLICLLFKILPSCEVNDDPIYVPIVVSGIPYYGIEAFTTVSSMDPVTASITLTNTNLEFLENFVLKVQKGDSRQTKASIVQIRIGGVVVVSTADFKKTNLASIPLTGFTNGLTLDVNFMGKAGTFIKILIEGTLKPNYVRDFDGNYYKTVVAAGGTWMAANLKTLHYNNGNLIETTPNPNTNIAGQTNPKYQWPAMGLESNVATYGRLYTWYAATDSRGICPTGWHVATLTEWQSLITYAGGATVAGGKLKEVGFVHWYTYSTGGTDNFGFTALPTGYRDPGGYYYDLQRSAHFFTSTEPGTGSTNCWEAEMYYYNTTASVHNSVSKNFGHAIRCMKNPL